MGFGSENSLQTPFPFDIILILSLLNQQHFTFIRFFNWFRFQFYYRNLLGYFIRGFIGEYKY